jgi:hypothetical protein
MTAKILKGNGQYQHRSTLRGLTEDELRDPDEIKARQDFDAEIEKRLGPSAKIENFFENPDIKTTNFFMRTTNRAHMLRRTVTTSPMIPTITTLEPN